MCWLPGSRRLGQHAEAEAAINNGASIAPGLLGCERAVFYAAHGRADEACATVANSKRSRWGRLAWRLSRAHIALGNHDAAFKWLAHRPAHAFLPWIRVHPPFAPIRKDPRFAALMAKMRLPMR